MATFEEDMRDTAHNLALLKGHVKYCVDALSQRLDHLEQKPGPYLETTLHKYVYQLDLTIRAIETHINDLRNEILDLKSRPSEYPLE